MVGKVGLSVFAHVHVEIPENVVQKSESTEKRV